MNKKRENQQKVLAAINNGFDFCIDQSFFLLLDEYFMPSESIGLDNVENFAEIFQAIKNFIATHKHEFSLGNYSSNENVADGFIEGQDLASRP